MELKKLDKALGKSFTMILDKLSKFIEMFKSESKKNFENVKGLEILLKSVSEDISKLHNKDYSDKFKEIEEKIKSKNFLSEKDDIIKEIKEIIKSVKNIKPVEVKTETIDTSKMELLLEKIYNKNTVLPDFEFKDISGSKYLKVYVDRTGSGLNTVNLFNEAGNVISPLTEGTGQAILEAVDGLEVSIGDVDVNTDGMETLQAATNTKLDTLNGKVATEAKQDAEISLLKDIKTNTASSSSAEWIGNLGIDKADATNYYFGYTQTGTTNWRIKRMNKSTFAIDWATGTTLPATAWTGRVSLSYSITI